MRGRSTSKKSASASAPPRKPDSFKRRRALKRGCTYVPIEDAHIMYVWAAYRRGVFSHLSEFPNGLSPQQFRERMFAALGQCWRGGGEVWVFHAMDGSDTALGMVVAHIAENRCEPHVFWFPEATPRNKLECALKWLADMKAKYFLFLWVKEPDWKFYNHLGKYGVCRCVGKYQNFPGGGDAYLFQGVT